MRRKYHHEEHENHERWMISYADFITLLFAFFVVLFASTYRDNQAIKKLARAIQNGFQSMGAFSADGHGNGGPNASLSHDLDSGNSPVPSANASKDGAQASAEANMMQLKKQLEKAMGKELANHEVVLQVTPAGFIISLKELGFFNSGEAELMPGAADKIIRIAKVVSRPGLEIRVEGHSDDQPIHTSQYSSNWELSGARAMSVLFLLVNKGGFDPAKISASGYGQYRPVADNTSSEGRRMNRRVDLVLMESRPLTPLAHPGAEGNAAPEAQKGK
jgi:chemotaxis protein MotB